MKWQIFGWPQTSIYRVRLISSKQFSLGANMCWVCLITQYLRNCSHLLRSLFVPVFIWNVLSFHGIKQTCSETLKPKLSPWTHMDVLLVWVSCTVSCERLWWSQVCLTWWGAAVEGLWGCSLKSHLPPVSAIYKPFVINTLRWDLEGPKWQVGETSSGFIALTTAPDVPSSMWEPSPTPTPPPCSCPWGLQHGWVGHKETEMGFKQLWSLARG